MIRPGFCLHTIGGGYHGFRWPSGGGNALGFKVDETEDSNRGKGTKWMVVVDGQGVPLGSQWVSASPGEVTLAESTLGQIRVPQKRGRPRQRPLRVIADRAYDRDKLRRRLLVLICPHRNPRGYRGVLCPDLRSGCVWLPETNHGRIHRRVLYFRRGRIQVNLAEERRQIAEGHPGGRQGISWARVEIAETNHPGYGGHVAVTPSSHRRSLLS